MHTKSISDFSHFGNMRESTKFENRSYDLSSTPYEIFCTFLIRALTLYEHTKFEVSSFSRSGDGRVITDRVTESLTDRQTDCQTGKTIDITTGFNIASFAYISGQRHKKLM